MGIAGCERGWFTVMGDGWMVFGVVAGGRECRGAGVSECRGVGVSECRSVGVQEYWRGGYASGKGEG